MRDLRVKARAKINLFLRVLARRPDGYHDIETVFQALELHDELVFRTESGASRLHVPGHPDLENEENLVLRAVRLLEGETGHRLPVSVRLDKRIPVAGGLGGGSSDAGATLVAVRALFDLDVSDPTLFELAQTLGADVPFFLKGGTVVGEGIGERLTPVSLSTDYHVLLVNPGFSVATGLVYAEFSRTLTGKSRESTVWNVLKRSPAWEDLLQNDLQPIAENLYPEIAEIRSVMKNSNLELVLMSGSGPTIFALGEKDRVERVRAALPARWPCVVTRPSDRGITID
jgi:4-diphosphocytidyl-2-C-methyl-D-erythritol kinase